MVVWLKFIKNSNRQQMLIVTGGQVDVIFNEGKAAFLIQSVSVAHPRIPSPREVYMLGEMSGVKKAYVM